MLTSSPLLPPSCAPVQSLKHVNCPGPVLSQEGVDLLPPLLLVLLQAWERFCARLPHTAVAHLFVSEAHLEGSDLKGRMRQAIRQNRR